MWECIVRPGSPNGTPGDNADVALGSPRITKVKKAGKGQLIINFESARSKPYVVEYSLTKDFKDAKRKEGKMGFASSPNIVIKGLKSGKKYFVRAYYYLGDSKESRTDWSNVVKYKVK